MQDNELGALADTLSPAQQRTSVNPGLGRGAWKLTFQLV